MLFLGCFLCRVAVWFCHLRAGVSHEGFSSRTLAWSRTIPFASICLSCYPATVHVFNWIIHPSHCLSRQPEGLAVVVVNWVCFWFLNNPPTNNNLYRFFFFFLQIYTKIMFLGWIHSNRDFLQALTGQLLLKLKAVCKVKVFLQAEGSIRTPKIISTHWTQKQCDRLFKYCAINMNKWLNYKPHNGCTFWAAGVDNLSSKDLCINEAHKVSLLALMPSQISAKSRAGHRGCVWK